MNIWSISVITAAVILTGALVALYCALRRAPTGFQDDTGFHYAKSAIPRMPSAGAYASSLAARGMRRGKETKLKRTVRAA
jgi:hypothetical protein